MVCLNRTLFLGRSTFICLHFFASVFRFGTYVSIFFCVSFKLTFVGNFCWVFKLKVNKKRISMEFCL